MRPDEVEHCIIVRKMDEPYQKDQVFYAYLSLNTKGTSPELLMPQSSEVIFQESTLTTDADGVPGDTTEPHNKSVAQGMIAYLIGCQSDPVNVKGDDFLNVQVTGNFQQGTRQVQIAGVRHKLTSKVPTRESLPQAS